MPSKKKQQNKVSADSPISTKPYRGARDFFPSKMQIRNYIFSVWRKVCRRYGFREYDFPILEPFEIFAAKTGEEIVNNQMFTLTDKSDRKLAMRPELTPGTVRMIARKFYELQKPIKWFMIGNNWRYEKPQKGRGREFYQLEMNTFGIEDAKADFEIFSAMIDIMKEFGADEKMFRLYFSDRRIITALLEDTLKLDSQSQLKVRRIMDKREKITKKQFYKKLEKLGVDDVQKDKIDSFMKSDLKKLEKLIPSSILRENEGFKSLNRLITLLKQNNLMKFCEFNPGIIRGFDYSNGTVYEIFDLDPENNRSIFGGERFDKLINIFGDYNLPATGFAMGDYTLLEFLKNWELLPDLENKTKILVTTFSSKTFEYAYRIAQELRVNGINTEQYLEPAKLSKQFMYADRSQIPYVAVIGPEEIEKDKIQLKDMKSGKQKRLELDILIETLKK